MVKKLLQAAAVKAQLKILKKAADIKTPPPMKILKNLNLIKKPITKPLKN